MAIFNSYVKLPEDIYILYIYECVCVSLISHNFESCSHPAMGAMGFAKVRCLCKIPATSCANFGEDATRIRPGFFDARPNFGSWNWWKNLQETQSYHGKTKKNMDYHGKNMEHLEESSSYLRLVEKNPVLQVLPWLDWDGPKVPQQFGVVLDILRIGDDLTQICGNFITW